MKTNRELRGEQQGEFKKEIGVFGGISIIGGIMIGSGIFYVGSYVLQRTHMSLGLSLLSWVLGGAVCLLGGLCFAELGACEPRAGGMRVYIERAYHPVWGYISGIISCFLSGPGSIAAIAIALPTALNSYFQFTDLQIKLIAAGLVILFTVINLFGVKLGALLANVSMAAKLIPLAIIMFGALIFGKVTPEITFAPADGTTASFGSMLGMVSFAVVAALWAYDGWVNLNSVAEEVRNPGRNLPLAIIGGIGAITVLYTLFNFAIYRVLPHEEIVSLINSGELYLGTVVADRLMGGVGGIVVTLAMVIAMISSLNGMVLTFSRVYYSMAADGMFFRSYKKLHPKYGVPTASLLLQMAICIVFIFLRSLDQLTSLVVFAGQILVVMCVSAVFAYRKKFPEMQRPYKVWGYPFTVILALLANIGLMANSVMEDPIICVISVVIMLAGALSYFYFAKSNKIAPQQSGNAEKGE